MIFSRFPASISSSGRANAWLPGGGRRREGRREDTEVALFVNLIDGVKIAAGLKTSSRYEDAAGEREDFCLALAHGQISPSVRRLPELPSGHHRICI